MSSGSRNTKVLSQPHQTIGAQDLLQVGASHSGFLRRRGRLERAVEGFALLKVFLRSAAKWRQRYVVISQGCVYLYADEVARRPMEMYSLNGYTRLQRLQPAPAGIQWAFTVSPDESTSGMKTYTFACPSDNDRMEWMAFLKKEMHLANDVPLPNSEMIQEYYYLEEVLKLSHQEIDETSNGSDDDSDYDKPEDIDELRTPVSNGRQKEKQKPNIPVPDIPVQEPKPQSKPAEKRPPPGGVNVMMSAMRPSPSSPTNTLNKEATREEFEFHGQDREDAIRLLGDRPGGTFLVRPSRQDDRQVLCIQTSEGVKEYKIYKQNWSHSLDNKTFFPTLEALITNYEENFLPNRATTLGRGYKSSDFQFN